MYTGQLSPRRAGRLAEALPPEAAIYRGTSLDERFMSLEARLLRHLFNAWVDEKDRIGTVDEYAEKQAREDRMVAKAEMMAARQRAREGV